MQSKNNWKRLLVILILQQAHMFLGKLINLTCSINYHCCGFNILICLLNTLLRQGHLGYCKSEG